MWLQCNNVICVAVFEPFIRAYIDNFKYQSITTADWKEFLYMFFKDKVGFSLFNVSLIFGCLFKLSVLSCHDSGIIWFWCCKVFPIFPTFLTLLFWNVSLIIITTALLRCECSRRGVKYIEMYLGTNTLEGFKYKYFKILMYLNTNTLESISNTFQILFICRIYYYVGKRKATHILRHLVYGHN